MTLNTLAGRKVRVLTVAAAILAALVVTSAPKPAHAIGPGAAVGLGLGAFTLGTVFGAGANPYYSPYYAPYYYYPPPAYYYPPPHYYGPRRCWSPYYGRYYPC